MTAREQRQQRHRLRTIRRRAAGTIALLALAAVLVVIIAARAQEETGEKISPPEVDAIPLATVTGTAGEQEETTAPTEETETASRYEGIEISDEDVYTLACLAYHEARGETFEGQVAVIEVALNRCLSDYFPDTVEESCKQKSIAEMKKVPQNLHS